MYQNMTQQKINNYIRSNIKIIFNVVDKVVC